jgi:hypothetical protein
VRIEVIPLIVGVLLGLVGLGLLADAWIPENVAPFRERRRRARTERSLGGEALIGLGVLCMAVAVMSRDTWDYVNVAIIAGGAFLFVGAMMNRRYLRERFSHRGALRRGEDGRGNRHEKDAPPPPRGRIR